MFVIIFSPKAMQWLQKNNTSFSDVKLIEVIPSGLFYMDTFKKMRHNCGHSKIEKIDFLIYI